MDTSAWNASITRAGSSAKQSGERGRSARLVRVERPSRKPPWLGGNLHEGGYPSRGFKSDEVGSGPQARRSAEGTILEIRMTLRMVVIPMVGREAVGVGRTELNQERGATRGHEPHWDIGTKDERGQ